MASREHSSYQQGIIRRYYQHAETIALQQLGEIVSDLYLSEKSQKLWDRARKALSRLASEDEHVKKVLASRDLRGLAQLVNDLNAQTRSPQRVASTEAAKLEEPIIGSAATRPEPPEAPPSPPVLGDAAPSLPASAAAPSPEQLKSAMKAFRKRMKLTKLDDESKLGRVGNPMSGGKRSQVVAIMAPREYPQAVWDELVRQGKLRQSGSFYELAE